MPVAGREHHKPRGSRELDRGGPLERPRDASGAPPELARSAQRVQQDTGDLKTAPSGLKKLTPEASVTSLLKLLTLPVRDPQLVLSGGRRLFPRDAES